MKNTVSILTFLLIYFVSFSQSDEIYLNDDFEFISKEEFEKKSKDPFDYNLRFESDTTFVNIKVDRSKKGKISQSQLDSIRYNLNLISEQKIDSNDVIFINYYPGDGPSNSKSYKENFRFQYRSYYRKIEKLENIKQFSIYKSSENIKGYGSKMDWIPDRNNLIENNFFPIHYPRGGYVILKEDGTYFCQRGEYCYTKKLIEQIKTFANNGSSPIDGSDRKKNN